MKALSSFSFESKSLDKDAIRTFREIQSFNPAVFGMIVKIMNHTNRLNGLEKDPDRYMENLVGKCPKQLIETLINHGYLDTNMKGNGDAIYDATFNMYVHAIIEKYVLKHINGKNNIYKMVQVSYSQKKKLKYSYTSSIGSINFKIRKVGIDTYKIFSDEIGKSDYYAFLDINFGDIRDFSIKFQKSNTYIVKTKDIEGRRKKTFNVTLETIKNKALYTISNFIEK